jgi:hypothetical protein
MPLDCMMQAYLLGRIAGGGHAPIICNNTFVDNEVGIWAGQLFVDPLFPPIGAYPNTHAPFILNNVFVGGSSAFEGIVAGNLLVARMDDVPLATPLDFNAWVVGHANLGFIPAYPHWTNSFVTTGFAIPPVPPSPRVDLTGLASLFVQDLLNNTTAIVPPPPHDLRLSPTVGTTSTPEPGNNSPLIPNPLIGAGINRAFPNFPGGAPALANQNGTGFDDAPGLPLGAEESPIHGWDNDCEGFGNNRLLPRSGIPNPSAQFGTIDIGADQCGGLIIAGYIPSTRMFAAWTPGTGTGNNRVLYVDQANQTGLKRPNSNWIAGLEPWVANVQMAPATLPSPYVASALSYYTPGREYPSSPAPIWTIRRFLYAFGWAGPFMRNLACDFSPSLLWDCHPFWGSILQSPLFSPLLYQPVFDPYACNAHYYAWFDLPTSPFLFSPDNAALFHNLLLSPHGAATAPGYQGQTTFVASSHINSPGTFLFIGGDLQFLLGGSSQFGPFNPACGTNFATGIWGMNDACPDVVPSLGIDLALRINCEIPRSLSPSNHNTNLQTFLVLPNAPQGFAGMSSSQSTTSNEAGLIDPRTALESVPSTMGVEVTESSFNTATQNLRSGLR